MINDPELSGKYLGTISADFVKAADTLKEASYQIRKAGFDYPIFAISKEVVPIGQLLVDKYAQQLEWNYFASFMDEFGTGDWVCANDDWPRQMPSVTATAKLQRICIMPILSEFV